MNQNKVKYIPATFSSKLRQDIQNEVIFQSV